MNDDVDTIWKRLLTLFQQSCNPVQEYEEKMLLSPVHYSDAQTEKNDASRTGRHRVFFN
jgi:hypothetical protein